MSDTETFVCAKCCSRFQPQSGQVDGGMYGGSCPTCGQDVLFHTTGGGDSHSSTKTKKKAAAAAVAVDGSEKDGKAADKSVATSTLSFTLNGVPVRIDNPDPHMMLTEYIRYVAGLKGTQKTCGEGGCGNCTVVLSNSTTKLAVNSCLRPLCSLEGFDVTTIEGIGSRSKGYHAIQEALAEHNGTQCGFCSPGWVMNMYGLLESNPKPSTRQVEDSFDGNLCRCTGYRPILEAMKTFAIDKKGPSTTDIEDFGQVCETPCKQLACAKDCTAPSARAAHFQSVDGTTWIRPVTLSSLYATMRQHADVSTKLVFGNTMSGIYKDEKALVYIDLSGVPDLRETSSSSDGLHVGATVSIAGLIAFLQQQAKLSPDSYVRAAKHLAKIATVPVRNSGCWAGNLMITHDHEHFPSDMFCVMAGLGAKLTIASAKDGATTSVDLFQFLQTDMRQRVILSLFVPVLEKGEVFTSFKIMRRHQNSHAYVNASFRLKLDDNFKVLSPPSLVFGGIGPYTVQASKTSQFLVGKSLNKEETLKGALASLQAELVPDHPPEAASREYRQTLALGLFFKAVVSFLPNISDAVKSAGEEYVRPISSGKQTFEVNHENAPISEPVRKVEAIMQTAGEACYVVDKEVSVGTLFAVFVMAKTCNAKLKSIDWSKALAAPGVWRVVTGEDLPGVNNFMPADDRDPERLFVKLGETIDYIGQAVGVVLADTQARAEHAATLVTMQTESLGKPILSIDDAIAENSFFHEKVDDCPMKTGEDIDAALKKADHVISGSVDCGGQYHFHMETQSTIVSPTDDGGIDILSSTQVIEFTHRVAAQVTGLDMSKIRVKVMRLGGGFGGKLSRCLPVSAAAAVCAHLTRRPVRAVLDINTNMRMLGKRHPFRGNYQVGFSKDGHIKALKMEYYMDCGSDFADGRLTGQQAMKDFENCYHIPNTYATVHLCKTNTAANTYMRAPGTCPAVFIAEMVLDHVAQAANMTPEEVRSLNFYKPGQKTPDGSDLKYCSIGDVYPKVLKNSDFDKRKEEIEKFNKENRWIKRGIATANVRYFIPRGGKPFHATVSIYKDGSVAVAHGGVEMGQGMNTKALQVIAHKFNVSLDKIGLEPSNVFNAPQNDESGGSKSSELVCEAVSKACDTLLERMKPQRNLLLPQSWEEWVGACVEKHVELTAHGYVCKKENDDDATYQSYGSVVTEVRFDVITGELHIPRVDMVYDCGRSLNPAVDIGQCEGAFVMGLGYMTCEKIKFDEDGDLVTDSTWEYKIPSSKDIPIDFRIEFLPNAPNPRGFLGSKASGEPPLCLASSVLSALKMGIASALADAGKPTVPLILHAPMTTEAIQLACQVEPTQFSL